MRTERPPEGPWGLLASEPRCHDERCTRRWGRHATGVAGRETHQHTTVAAGAGVIAQGRRHRTGSEVGAATTARAPIHDIQLGSAAARTVEAAAASAAASAVGLVGAAGSTVVQRRLVAVRTAGGATSTERGRGARTATRIDNGDDIGAVGACGAAVTAVAVRTVAYPEAPAATAATAATGDEHLAATLEDRGRAATAATVVLVTRAEGATGPITGTTARASRTAGRAS
jgi:hypothetical protein